MVLMDLDGVVLAREWVEEVGVEHLLFVDIEYQFDVLFGVVNVPNVIWIDENGVIVWLFEFGWVALVQYFEWLLSWLEEQVCKVVVDVEVEGCELIDLCCTMNGGQDRDSYVDVVRDWVCYGLVSWFAMILDEVIWVF